MVTGFDTIDVPLQGQGTDRESAGGRSILYRILTCRQGLVDAPLRLTRQKGLPAAPTSWCEAPGQDTQGFGQLFTDRRSGPVARRVNTASGCACAIRTFLGHAG